jgi:hypothetical protein
MGRKCTISAVVMFIMAWGLSFLVHGVLLSGDYSVTQGMRPPAEAQQLIPFLILAQALFGIAFAWIYVQGKDDRPWPALRHRGRIPDRNPDLSDLSRRHAGAAGACLEADRVRYDPGRANGHRARLDQPLNIGSV